MIAQTLATLVAVAATLVGVGCTVCLLVLGVASAPNATPRRERLVRAFMWSTFLGGGAAAVAAGWLLFAGRPWAAAAVGSIPTLILNALLLGHSIRQVRQGRV